MSNVIPFSDTRRLREQARDQAGIYLARLDAGASAEDRQEIEAWLAASPLHRTVLLEMAALWDEFEVLNSLAEVFPLEEYASRPRARRRTLWAAAACTAMLALGLAWLLPGLERPSQTPAPLATAGQFQQQHRTAIGEQSTIRLPDGSSVVLNTNSVLEVMYTGSARNIFLARGEAFFTVTRDTERPFRVYAGQRVVEAVGTAFTVQHVQPGNVEVVVTEGQVNVLPLQRPLQPQSLPSDINTLLDRGSNIALKAGDYATSMQDLVTPPATQQIDIDALEVKLAWTEGMLLYQGNSLGQVLDEFSRYTTTRLEADEALLSIQVNGFVEAGNTDDLLTLLKENLKIEAERVADDRILLHASHFHLPGD